MSRPTESRYTLTNRRHYNWSTALARSITNYWCCVVQTGLSMHFLRPSVGCVGFYFHHLYLVYAWRILTNTHNCARTGRYFRAARRQKYCTTAQRSFCDSFIVTSQQSQHKILLKIWKMVCGHLAYSHISYLTCRFIWGVLKIIILFWERERERERERQRQTDRQTERDRERERQRERI